MNDKDLADKIVALGVGYHDLNNKKSGKYDIDNQIGRASFLTAEQFIHDWRVAGTCLEQWPTTINTEHLQLSLDEMLRHPVAICEAFAEANK